MPENRILPARMRAPFPGNLPIRDVLVFLHRSRAEPFVLLLRSLGSAHKCGKGSCLLGNNTSPGKILGGENGPVTENGGVHRVAKDVHAFQNVLFRVKWVDCRLQRQRAEQPVRVLDVANAVHVRVLHLR